jgi:hypothetical protein
MISELGRFDRYKVIDGLFYERQLLTTLAATDNDSYIALGRWYLTDQGSWAAKHGKDIVRGPTHMDYRQLAYTTNVTGYFKPEDWTFWLLRWSA